MKQRKWDGKSKARAVLEGIKGRKVAEICNDYKVQVVIPWESSRFLQAITILGGNAETERSIRTLKEELFWIKEWQGVKQVEDALDEWAGNYNRAYLHSALGYKSPEWIEENFSKQEVA